MPRKLFFITHPNVVVDPATPVRRWHLSGRGVERMRAGLFQPWLASITAIYCSCEQKAIDGARIVSDRLGLGFECREALGENDRSSTGFLPPDEFERVADEFFAHPDVSVRGWETASAAQRRIVAAVDALIADDRSTGNIAVVSHGAVGTLLYCHLVGEPISRTRDQPANGGGNYFCFELVDRRPEHWWGVRRSAPLTTAPGQAQAPHPGGFLPDPKVGESPNDPA
jgi:broad specificity phosphatase PhoE